MNRKIVGILICMLFIICYFSCMVSAKAVNTAAQTEIIVRTTQPSIWAELYTPPTSWSVRSNPLEVNGWRHLYAHADNGERLKGSWVTEFRDSQGNKLPWTEEIEFDVYQCPEGSNVNEEIKGDLDDNWYLHKGWDCISIKSYANWEYFEWNYETNKWDPKDIGHLEDYDRSPDFWVSGKGRSIEKPIVNWFNNLIYHFPLFEKILKQRL